MTCQEQKTIIAGGEMAERVRSFAWSQTSLGPLESWPDCLLSTVATLLESPIPQLLLCGPEFMVCAYNDAYRPLLGHKPQPLGRSYLEVYSEAKSVTADLLQKAWAGKSCLLEGARLKHLQDGPAEALYDFALSPVRGPRGERLGVIIPDDAAEWVVIGDYLLRSGEPARIERPFVNLGRILEGLGYRVEDGTNRRIAVIFTDVTSRRRAEEAIREAAHEKTEFLAVLSHELRNPLAPLRTSIELLESVRSDPDLLDTLRPMMERQLAHLTHLVDDLIDISRISRGKVELQNAELDLNAAVEAAIERTRPLIAAHRHNLRVLLSDTSLPIRGDHERLTQVVSTLLSNAAHYSEPGGTITLVTDSEGDQAAIRVRDTGYGIPPERMGRLFEMFSQVPEHRRKTGGGGLGVGLALSKRLLDLHGGSITARSRGLGFGSEFTVHVPLAETTHPTPSPRPAREAVLHFQG